MHIKSIELYNYRSYAEAAVSFDPGVNVIKGMNGQGKTNLLEAVAYLSTGHAFRSRRDANVIRWDCSECSVRGTVSSKGDTDTIETKLYLPPRKKQVLINGVKQKSLAPLAGKFGTVLFCPEDMGIAKESASERRNFLDCAIEQLRPRYAEAVRQYRKLLDSKTRILRDWEEKPSLLDALDDFSLEMCRVGAAVISYRAAYIRKLKEIAKEIHRQISGGREELQLEYRTVSSIDDPLLPASQLVPLLEQHYFAHKNAEISSRSCLSGPHKDDIDINIGGRSVKNFGSQGQTRTAVLAMKLAERQMYKEDTGVCPVLLLDDVLSELDDSRQAFVLGKIEDGQVLITCSNSSAFPGLGGKAFSVSAGIITEESR